jgi:predicted bacteriocin transport accessory protein
MSQKTVLLAGLIGLVFGFLFSGTLGISFFNEDPVIDNSNPIIEDNDDNEMVVDNNDNDETMDDEEETPDPRVEQFKIDYNLSDSIYIPIDGDDVSDLLNSGEDFIVFAGRKGCPYCQQFVPVLQAAAKSLGVSVIYYIDITDDVNDSYLDFAGFEYPNSTFIYVDGVLQENIVGYQTETNTVSVLTNYFSN